MDPSSKSSEGSGGDDDDDDASSTAVLDNLDFFYTPAVSGGKGEILPSPPSRPPLPGAIRLFLTPFHALSAPASCQAGPSSSARTRGAPSSIGAGPVHRASGPASRTRSSNRLADCAGSPQAERRSRIASLPQPQAPSPHFVGFGGLTGSSAQDRGVGVIATGREAHSGTPPSAASLTTAPLSAACPHETSSPCRDLTQTFGHSQIGPDVPAEGTLADLGAGALQSAAPMSSAIPTTGADLATTLPAQPSLAQAHGPIRLELAASARDTPSSPGPAAASGTPAQMAAFSALPSGEAHSPGASQPPSGSSMAPPLIGGDAPRILDIRRLGHITKCALPLSFAPQSPCLQV